MMKGGEKKDGEKKEHGWKEKEKGTKDGKIIR